MPRPPVPPAPQAPPEQFGRRERQIMHVIYRLGSATVGDVITHLPDPPSYSAVRAMLRYLERKGHLRHARDGVRYVYEPTVPHADAQRSALQQLVRTFFRGSRAGAVAALLELPDKELSEVDLERLRALVRRARREGR
jgi:BlaI family transcriptional regulator, penicillinase repressor